MNAHSRGEGMHGMCTSVSLKSMLFVHNGVSFYLRDEERSATCTHQAFIWFPHGHNNELMDNTNIAQLC